MYDNDLEPIMALVEVRIGTWDNGFGSPPFSSNNTFISGCFESRFANTQPAAPPPTIITIAKEKIILTVKAFHTNFMGLTDDIVKCSVNACQFLPLRE